jgi:hypothetical protein
MATLKQYKESANEKAWRGLLIALAAIVVLSVSGYGTVIYIQLMGKVFPAGPLQLACYMGAAANFLLEDLPMYSPADVERLQHIANAAQARGYDLDTMAWIA